MRIADPKQPNERGRRQRPRPFLGLLLTYLAFSLAIPYCVRAQQPAVAQKKFETEAPRGWEGFRNFYRTLQGSYSGETRDLTGETPTRRGGGHFKQCDGNTLEEREDRGVVWAKNSQYTFQLIRKSETTPWVIREISKRSADDLEKSKSQLYPAPVGLLLNSHPPMDFDGLVTNPHFHFQPLEVTLERENGNELVRVKFSCSAADIQLRGGWVLLDPNQDWVIRKGELDLVNGETTSKTTQQTEFRAGSNGHPVPTKDFWSGIYKQGERVVGHVEVEDVYDLHEQKNVPESEFTLSAYGFPEPSWIEQKKTRWYLWFALAGGVCLAAGAAWRWRKRNVAEAPSPR